MEKTSIIQQKDITRSIRIRNEKLGKANFKRVENFQQKTQRSKENLADSFKSIARDSSTATTLVNHPITVNSLYLILLVISLCERKKSPRSYNKMKNLNI